MLRSVPCLKSVLAALVTLLLGASATVMASTPAQALSSGVAFSAESLPTWQVDGFAYATTASQGRVVVGGNFTRLLPPSGQSASPVATTALAILDADSGNPVSCQLSAGALSQPTPTIFALNTSPDGRTVYVGGDFSSLGGVGVSRFAAIDVATCQVKPLRVDVSSKVLGITSTAGSVYLAGEFTRVAGQARSFFAALDPTTGALQPFAPVADKPGRAMAVSPDGQKLAIGGAFTTINSAPSHSIAVVSATTGATVKAYGAGFVDAASVTKTIVSDSTGFYVGNEGTGGGVFDGRLAVDWSTLNERWRDTCLGATQALVVYQGILYSGSHSHDCGSIGYYPDGVRKFFVAETTADRTFRGWSPTANDGVNEKIGPRGLALVQGASGASYLYAVGEFTQINGVAQQGITRFGTTDQDAPAAPYVQAEALRSNAVQVRIWTVVDNDDDTLTYRIFRNGSTTPIWTGKATSFWWTRPQITVTDTAVEAGKAYSYRVTASDGNKESPLSGAASATARTKAVDYPAQVIADGAQLYWRYEEPSGTWTWNKGIDSTSAPNGQLNKGVKLGVTGAFASKGAAFDGVDDFAWNDALRTSPSTFTLETWFNTTTTRGGKLIGFSNGRPSTKDGTPLNPTSYDRHVYMDNSGRLNFGTYNGSAAVVTSAKSYNDGGWHQVVATFGSGGTTLYVDGASVGYNARSVASTYPGIWKVGGDKLDGWVNAPSSRYFAGSIDETAVYEGKALTSAVVADHYRLGGGVLAAGDTAAPTQTAGVKASVSGTDVGLVWQPATDDTGVSDYSVYRGASSDFAVADGTRVYTGAAQSFVDVARPAGKAYYRVTARDAAGNVSAASDAVRADVPDTTAPTAPGQPRASVDGSSVALEWASSTDDVGVAGYVVYRGSTSDFVAGPDTEVGRPGTSSYVDAERPAGTWYYRVSAADEAGNLSAPSSATAVRLKAATVRKSVSLTPVEDTMVAENNPGATYATYGQLSTRKSSNKDEIQSYLRFDTSAIDADATLVGAELTLTTSNDDSAPSSGRSEVRLLTGTWSDAVTWPSRPTGLGPVLGSLGSAPSKNSAYTVVLDTAGLTREASGSLSLALTSTVADNLRISSREGAKPPLLQLTYES